MQYVTAFLCSPAIFHCSSRFTLHTCLYSPITHLQHHDQALYLGSSLMLTELPVFLSMQDFPAFFCLISQYRPSLSPTCLLCLSPCKWFQSSVPDHESCLCPTDCLSKTLPNCCLQMNSPDNLVSPCKYLGGPHHVPSQD